MDFSFDLIVESFELNRGFYLFVSTLFGLALGSFANVVIYRLPIMMEREFEQNCKEHLKIESEQIKETFNLAVPNSRCPHCQSPIRYWQNIPIISYLLLKGACANCGHKISVRYPIIEAICGLLTFWAAFHFGVSWQALGAMFFSWTLLILTMIDLDRMWLPDNITLPFMWAGLLLSLGAWYTDIQSALLGACIGYLILWSLYHAFKLLTGKEGMGFGDFKLLAALGAWLGIQLLPIVILLSSVVATIIGLGQMILQRRGRYHRIPYGPYLALAGFICLYWGDQLAAWIVPT